MRIRLSAEQATEQAVTTTAEAKPLAELLSSKKFYSLEKAAPAPRFGVQPQWKVSEDFVPPKDGKLMVKEKSVCVCVCTCHIYHSLD